VIFYHQDFKDMKALRDVEAGAVHNGTMFSFECSLLFMHSWLLHKLCTIADAYGTCLKCHQSYICSIRFK
jgi:hypothetical protein